MNLFGKTRSKSDRNASVLGAVGLSAIALFNFAQPANATSVSLGYDYLKTGSGTFFDFGPGIGSVNFRGLPIDTTNLRSTDTIMSRQANANLPTVGSSATIPIQVADLSLKSVNSVNIGGSFYDVFATLDNNTASTGTMTIRHGNSDTAATQGTWDSSFHLYGKAIIAPQGQFNPSGGGQQNLLTGCATYQCVTFDKVFTTSNASWSHNPGSGDFIGPNSTNFFTGGRVPHNAPNAEHSTLVASVALDAVPEPVSTMLGSILAFGVGAGLKNRYSKKSKNNLKTS